MPNDRVHLTTGASCVVFDISNLDNPITEVNKLMLPVNWTMTTPFIYVPKPTPPTWTQAEQLTHFDAELEKMITGLTKLRERTQTELSRCLYNVPESKKQTI